MSDIEAPAKKQKAPVARKKTLSKRDKKKLDDDGKPKRPLSAYNLFFRDERVKWNEEQESAGQQLHAKERFLALGKAMSSRWMTLSEEKKKIYKDEAEGAMEKYRGEMAAWQAIQKEKLKEAKLKKPAPEPEADGMNANQRAQMSNPAALQQALNQQGIASQLGGMLNQNSLGMQQPGMAQLLGAGGLDPQMQQLLMNNQSMLGGMGMGGLGGLGGMGGLQGANMGGFGLGGGNMSFGGGNGMGMFQNDQLAQLQLRQQQLQQQQLQQQQLQQQQLQQQQLQQQQFGGMPQHQQLGLQNQQQQQFGGLHQNGLSPQLGSMGGGDVQQQQQFVQEYLRHQQQLQQQQNM